MLKLYNYEGFNFYDTLKNTSLNKKGKDVKVYMTESLLKVIDFDKVKNKYASAFRLEKLPASNDALLQRNDKIIFIEFKDGNMKQEYHEVVRKIYESLLIFCDITKQTISDTRNYMIYILVYNGEASRDYIKDCMNKPHKRETGTINESLSFIKFGSVLGGMANKNPDIFGLRGRFAGIYFQDVLTIEKSDFTDRLLV